MSDRWFTQGLEALRLARPAIPPNLYCCPLCVHGFSSRKDVIPEHVPPRSVGGRRVVLTCHKCNHRSGHQLDYHVRRAADLREFADGKRELRATVTAEGMKVTATVKKTANEWAFAGLPEQSNKQHHAAFFDRFDKAASSGSTDWGFSATLHAGYDPWAESLAWLRAGYLIAFAALGYTYILRPELNCLRAQLAKPQEKIIPCFAARASGYGDAEVNRLSIIYEPVELRSVVVQFGGQLIFLPDFTARMDFFERLNQFPASQTPWRFVGRRLSWPTKPVLALDFQPFLLAEYFAEGGPGDVE